MVNETLGLWRLVKGIGRGGMGEVYAAEYDYLHLLTLRYPPEERGLIKAELAELPRHEQARLAGEMLGTQLPADAEFAIKICSAREGTAGYRRFLQEAELAQRLGVHPHIVTVHAINGVEGASGGTGKYDHLQLDTGKHRNLAYMVMDLAACDYEHNKLKIPEAVHVVRCIATALDHAHRCGIVHRDLKPENLLGSIQHPLLTDFGIAKELDQSLGLTRTGQIIGTLDYMSPEQATDAKNVDHRSDIYSLGVVLYEMTTKGQLPYIHLAKREAALAAIRSEKSEPKWPRQHLPEYPRGLEYIVLKAMAHRQEERYQQMSELLSDLDRWQRGEWINPIGHLTLRRYWRYLVNRHPKALLAVGATVAVIGAIWLLLVLKESFDTVRRSLDDSLASFETAVVNVENGLEQQLDSSDLIEDLQRDFNQHGEAYPELTSKWHSLLDRLNRSRWLRGTFSAEVKGEVQAHEGQRQLRLATQQQLDVTATLDGLRFLRQHDLTFAHGYGSGTVYCNILIDLPDGPFGWTITDEAKRHQTVLRYEAGRLTLAHIKDERPPEYLFSEPMGRPIKLDAAIEVSDQGLIFYLPKMRGLQRIETPMLRQGSPASISATIPAGAVLKYIEIRPRGIPR